MISEMREISIGMVTFIMATIKASQGEDYLEQMVNMKVDCASASDEEYPFLSELYRQATMPTPGLPPSPPPD